MKALAAVVGFAACLVAQPVFARDWFVRAGADGDGSQSKPFGDPWQALDQAQSGDVIHVAGGKYSGRLGSGMWEIPFDDVQLLGGYDADFKSRDPWKHLTQLHWDKASKNRPKQERLTSTKKGTVVDGFTIDQRDQCPYETAEQLGRKEYPSSDGPMRFALPATVRNCVLVNPGFDGIVAPVGSTIENNLIVNAVNWGININSTTDKQAVAVVKNNTVAFTMSFKEPGKGAYNGSGIALKGHAQVTGNVIAFSDSNGIYLTANPEKSTLTDNVFFMNLYANLKLYVEGKDIPVDDKQMELLDEVGFKKVSGNEVKNPQLPVDPTWLDHVSRRTAATPGKLVMDDFNKARQLMGLPMIAKGGSAPSGVAPAMDLEKALKLLAPKSAGQAGARVKALPVSFTGATAAAPDKAYRRMEVGAWIRKPESVDGQPLELVVAVSNVANVSGVPAPFKADEHAGVFLHEPTGSYDRFVGFYKKGSSAQRAADAAAGYWQGSGAPLKLYLAKGIAYQMKGVPKAGFQVDSLEPYEAGGGAAAGKPQGRDWFVRAGATGGDGTREKPFKDPGRRWSRWRRATASTWPRASTTASSRRAAGRSTPPPSPCWAGTTGSSRSATRGSTPPGCSRRRTTRGAGTATSSRARTITAARWWTASSSTARPTTATSRTGISTTTTRRRSSTSGWRARAVSSATASSSTVRRGRSAWPTASRWRTTSS